MKKTNIEIKSEFWLFVEFADPKGYHTGRQYEEKTLIEFETVSELLEFHEIKSVESGESMGDYIYNILGQSHSWRIYDQILDAERID